MKSKSEKVARDIHWLLLQSSDRRPTIQSSLSVKRSQQALKTWALEATTPRDIPDPIRTHLKSSLFREKVDDIISLLQLVHYAQVTSEEGSFSTCSTANSVAVELSFSEMNLQHSKLRNRLEVSQVRKLTYIKMNHSVLKSPLREGPERTCGASHGRRRLRRGGCRTCLAGRWDCSCFRHFLITLYNFIEILFTSLFLFSCISHSIQDVCYILSFRNTLPFLKPTKNGPPEVISTWLAVCMCPILDKVSSCTERPFYKRSFGGGWGWWGGGPRPSWWYEETIWGWLICYFHHISLYTFHGLYL